MPLPSLDRARAIQRPSRDAMLQRDVTVHHFWHKNRNLFEQAWANQPDNQRSPVTVEVLPKKLDEEVAQLMVEGFGGVVTRLTTEQADYIGVTTEGPFKPEAYKY